MIKLVTLIDEGRFGRSGKLTHIMNVPMFSIYVAVNTINVTKELESKIKSETSKAKNEIHKIGFPSMHANIVIRDLSQEPNINTGGIGVAGLAHYYKKFMEVDPNYFTDDVIVHEWAHLWMMNHSKEFKKAIRLMYQEMMKNVGSKIDTSQFMGKQLSSEEELKVITAWSSEIKRMFKYMLYEREVNAYILKYLKLTPDLFPRLPHLLSIKAKLIKPLTVHDLSSRSKTLPSDYEVDVIKGNSGWLIGTEISGRRYETLTDNHNEINDYVKSTRSDIVNDLTLALRQNNKHYREYNTPLYLIGKIKDDITIGIRRGLEEVGRKFKVSANKEEVALVQSWANYILPAFLKIIKSRKLLTSHQQNEEQIYDSLWVNNEYKPKDLSFAKLFTNIINRNKADSYKYSFSRSSLSGKEFESQRETMRNLNNWVNSYGMSNEDELWSSAVEYFFKLPQNHRKAIIKIMMSV